MIMKLILMYYQYKKNLHHIQSYIYIYNTFKVVNGWVKYFYWYNNI